VNVDVIIVGQGICGTLLSFELIKRGKSVLVFDDGNVHASSKVAAGLINPVTGKRFVKSWMYDRLIEVAANTYAELEEQAGRPLIRSMELIQFHKDDTEERTFDEKTQQEEELRNIGVSNWQYLFSFSFGGGSILPCYIVDSNMLLNFWRERLLQSGLLIEGPFDHSLCRIADSVSYMDIKARHIIYCNGTSALQTPWFSALPFSINKGEAVIADIPDLPNGYIFKNVLKIIPLSGSRFWVGSSFDWKYETLRPTEHFRTKAEAWLNSFLKVPFTIVDHIAAERPSSVDYKPFIGLHPSYPSIGIFNGMGTKGYSQAPFFARQFAAYLCGCGDIMPDVDIKRFNNLLRRFQKA